MKAKKIIIFSVILLIIVTIIYNHALVYYGLVQARGQLKIILNTVPVRKILQDPQTPDTIKNKIRLIQEVRAFATDFLGLAGKRNYTTYYDQHGKELMWVVTACEPYDLVSYTWDFPFLGSVTYKGFFIPEMAEKEAARLNFKGYDTSIRNAGGWSTLGILKDPILSGMLERTDDALAELIIHELTHGTIFLRNDVSFNENLATFIGLEGTKAFLSRKFGPEYSEVSNYKETVEDRNAFSDFVLDGAAKLEDLYRSFDPGWTDEKMANIKSEWFRKFVFSLDTVHFNDSGRYRDYFKTIHPNNTFIMSYMRYRGGLSQFEKEFHEEFKGDLTRYIEYLKREYN